MNFIVKKYSHPHRVTPHSSVTKRYVYRGGKMVEVPLTEKLTDRVKMRQTKGSDDQG